MHSIDYIDSHTGGEPTRVVLSSVPGMDRGSLAERRAAFAREHDRWRSAIACEPRGSDTMVLTSPTTVQRLETVRRAPLLDALRSHDGHPKGVCRHVDEAEPWVDQSVTVASVVMNLEKLRLHVASGPPCTHEHQEITLPSASRLASTAAR